MTSKAIGAHGTAPARRPFYADAWLYFLLGLGVTVAGFWPSFFSRPAANPVPHTLHGVVATGWLVLLVTQAGLMRLRRPAWHRTLGKAGYVLMPALIVTGAWVLHLMLAGQSRLPVSLARMLGFIDLVTLLFLAAAFALAIANRRDVQLHARWMATTLLIVLPPGLTRLMFVLFDAIPMSRALALAYAMLVAVCAVLVYVDWRGGTLRAPYLAAGATLAGTYAALGPIAGSPQWAAVAGWIGGR
jgi:hypothetical protein